MTVSDLISKLTDLPQDKEVVIQYLNQWNDQSYDNDINPFYSKYLDKVVI